MTKKIALIIFVLVGAVAFFANANTAFASETLVETVQTEGCSDSVFDRGQISGGYIKDETPGGTARATYTNNADYSQYVGIASYQKYDSNIENQVGHDKNVVCLGPGETVQLSVSVPACAAQIDSFVGKAIWPTFGQNERYGDRLISYRHTGGSNYCGEEVQYELIATPIVDCYSGWSVTAAATPEGAVIDYQPSQNGNWENKESVEVTVTATWSDGHTESTTLRIEKPEGCEEEVDYKFEIKAEPTCEGWYAEEKTLEPEGAEITWYPNKTGTWSEGQTEQLIVATAKWDDEHVIEKMITVYRPANCSNEVEYKFEIEAEPACEGWYAEEKTLEPKGAEITWYPNKTGTWSEDQTEQLIIATAKWDDEHVIEKMITILRPTDCDNQVVYKFEIKAEPACEGWSAREDVVEPEGATITWNPNQTGTWSEGQTDQTITATATWDDKEVTKEVTILRPTDCGGEEENPEYAITTGCADDKKGLVTISNEGPGSISARIVWSDKQDEFEVSEGTSVSSTSTEILWSPTPVIVVVTTPEGVESYNYSVGGCETETNTCSEGYYVQVFAEDQYGNPVADLLVSLHGIGWQGSTQRAGGLPNPDGTSSFGWTVPHTVGSAGRQITGISWEFPSHWTQEEISKLGTGTVTTDDGLGFPTGASRCGARKIYVKFGGGNNGEGASESAAPKPAVGTCLAEALVSDGRNLEPAEGQGAQPLWLHTPNEDGSLSSQDVTSQWEFLRDAVNLHPSLSYDNCRQVFTSDGTLWYINPDGSAPYQWVDKRTGEVVNAAHPDFGLYFTVYTNLDQEGQLYLTTEAGWTNDGLYDQDGNPIIGKYADWSPNGRHIVYVDDTNNLWAVDIAYTKDGGFNVIDNNPLGYLGYSPRFSADGTEVIFTGLFGESYTVPFDGSGEIEVAADFSFEVSYDEHVGSDKAIYQSQGQLWMVDSENTEGVRITGDQNWPKESPTILFGTTDWGASVHNKVPVVGGTPPQGELVVITGIAGFTVGN